MEITALKDNTFLNNWLAQIPTKVHYVPDNVLVQALQYIEEKGIPTIKNEQYKNVPIESILKRNFRNLILKSETAEDIQNFRYPNTIIISNNKTSYQLKEEGIQIYEENTIKDIYKKYIGSTSLHTKDFFAALNTAYCSHLSIIHIQKTLQYPIYIHHQLSSHSNFQQSRILVIVDKSVECTIFSEISGNVHQPTFLNILGEVFMDENALINWISKQKDTSQLLYTITNYAFSLAGSAKLKHHQISLNGAMWRNNLNIHINDKAANAELKGLSIGKNQNIISQNTAILHHSGYAHSNQLYKNIADDKSTVLFNGFILVNKNAQKTNAYQSSKNLLLNDNATIFAKPQLEIYADDVKCSHGSSTGALNEDAMFYLRARGIDKTTAQKLLLHAFFNDILESIENTHIREYIQNQIHI
ncbi:MAG: Fe-S cluster assembly protein SufD [Bacteroidia bacterium]|nr:Fe-S cluster assembly protein SufD [Bacteroidia bacterium]